MPFSGVVADMAVLAPWSPKCCGGRHCVAADVVVVVVVVVRAGVAAGEVVGGGAVGTGVVVAMLGAHRGRSSHLADLARRKHLVIVSRVPRQGVATVRSPM